MIKVITYNILSDRWAIYKENVSSTHKLKSRYAFVSPELLLWQNRLPKIIEIIKDYDIICLQEVDLISVSDIINLLPEYDYAHHIMYTEEYKKDKNVYKRTNPIGNMTLWKNIEYISHQCNS